MGGHSASGREGGGERRLLKVSYHLQQFLHPASEGESEGKGVARRFVKNVTVYICNFTKKPDQTSSPAFCTVEDRSTEFVEQAREPSVERGEGRLEPEGGQVEPAGPAPSLPVAAYTTSHTHRYSNFNRP